MEVALAAADDTAAAPPSKGERVLLVDDEAPLLAATAEFSRGSVTNRCHSPMGAPPSAAFDAAAPGRFDVVVTM